MNTTSPTRSFRSPVSGLLSFLSLIILCSSFLFLSCSSPPPTPQWEFTGGPYAQNISTVHTDDQAQSTVYAGTTDGGFFVSTDQGNSWARRATLAPDKAILTIIQHPEQLTTLYAGTAGGVFLSTDNGNHWKNLSIEPVYTCRTLAIDPFNPIIMYAGIDRKGLYKSSNGGELWEAAPMEISAEDLASAEFLDIVINQSNPDVLYVAIASLGIFTTTNGGKTWKALTAQLAASGTVATHLLLHQRLQGQLCFGTAAGDVYKSKDGGASWSPTRQGDGINGIGGFAVNPADPNLVYSGTETGVMVSFDFGTTWKETSTDQPNIPCSITGTSSNPHMLYAYGEGTGFRRSTNGGKAWTKCETGLGSSSVSLLSSDPRNSKVYATTGKGLYYYSQQAAAWISASNGLHGGDIASIAYDIDSNATMFAGCTHAIYTTTNGGSAWQSLPKTFGPYPVKFFDTHASIRTRMFVATTAAFSYSTDRGNTWNPTKPFGGMYDVRSITYSPNNSGILHAALRDKASVGSTDGGITWASHRYGIKSENVLAITSSDTENKVLYAWTANGDGFRSVNQGIEWDRYTPPWLINDNVLVWVDKKHSNKVVALVNKKHLHYSENGGGTWKSLQVEELKQNVLSILWSEKESALYAGTRDQGVFRIRVGKVFAHSRDAE